jgi:anti-sigma B factor antagonist
MNADPALTVRVSQRAGYAVVTVIGSIDVTTHDLLGEQLDRALHLTRLAVIVDLSEVDFCDSTGLNTFTQAHRKVTARGITMVTAGLRDRVEYVFAVTRLKQAFYAQPDLDTAVRWLENGTIDVDPAT